MSRSIGVYRVCRVHKGSEIRVYRACGVYRVDRVYRVRFRVLGHIAVFYVLGIRVCFRFDVFKFSKCKWIILFTGILPDRF